jgi:Universal stress protein UspA and related nucleotide-binding proteins
MPLMYKNILVPVDGSRPSFDAIRHAIDLAKITSGIIDLVHVVDVADQVQVYTHLHSSYSSEDYLEEFMALGDEVIKEAANKVPPELRGQTLVKIGEPKEFLLQFIGKHRYDLVVIGCQGLSALPGFFLGSVSQYLVQNASCPVMVVK